MDHFFTPMHYKNFARNLFFVSLLVFQPGCELTRASRDIKDGLDKLALSVPGERYLRLIDDVRSTNKATADRAKQFAQDLFNIQLDGKYQAEVYFESKSKTSLEISIFQSHIPDPRQALDWEKQNSSIFFQSATASVMPPNLRKAKIKKIEDHLTAAAAACVPMPLPSGSSGHYDPNPFETFRKSMLAAIEETLPDDGDGVSVSSVPMNWTVLDGRPLLYVVIPKTQWERERGNVRIYASVHLVGRPRSETITGRGPHKFRLAEFKELPLEDPRIPATKTGPETKVVCAIQNMTGEAVLSPELFNRLASTSRILAEWSKQSEGGGK